MKLTMIIKLGSIFLLIAGAAAMLVYYFFYDHDFIFIVTPIAELIVSIRIFVSDVFAPTEGRLYILMMLTFVVVPLIIYAIWRCINRSDKSKPDNTGEALLAAITVAVLLHSVTLYK